MTSPNSRHAHVVGLGLIGASVALALKEAGWIVTGVDSVAATVTSAIDVGVITGTELSPDVDLVVIASHVPHLLAGSLMNEASQVAEQDAVLLQLAAGGFRDMTRIAAGDPGIWPDILFENRDAVVQSLEALEGRLKTLREALLDDGRDLILDSLLNAASARRQLPGRALSTEDLAYLRVNVSDEPGVLARVTRSASDLAVNIYDIEIAHGIEGTGGTLLLAVDAQQSQLFGKALSSLGFQVALEQ